MIVSVALLMAGSFPFPTPPYPCALREAHLELVERGRGRRVDALQHGHVERDQVTEEHQRQRALDAPLPARLDPYDVDRVLGDQLARDVDPIADPRMLVGVLEED